MTVTIEPGSPAAKAVAWLRRHPEVTRVDTASLCAAISVGRGHVLERVKPALDAGLMHYASRGAGHKAWWSLNPLAEEEIEVDEHPNEEGDWPRRTSAPEIQPRPGPFLPGVNVSVYGATGAA